MASVGKVLIIVQNLPVPFDRRVWLEATTLNRAGYQVSVISPAGQEGQYPTGHEILDGVHLYRYPAPPAADSVFGYAVEFAYCWLLTALLSVWIWLSRGFDVIHACNPPETYFLLAWFYKLLGKKFLFDHHDLSPEMYLAKGGQPGQLLYRGLLWLEHKTFKTADIVITTNQSHRTIAQTRGGVDRDRIYIVRSGPDFERLKVLRPEPELKGGFPFLACYLGEMCPQDGVDRLFFTIKLLVDEFGRRDIKFVLMGGGAALEDLKLLKTGLGLDEFVEFTGRVSDHDLCRYLSTADLCLDPDPYTDWADKSTMNKIVEYMAFGKPIVAFDLTEHRYSAQKAAVYAPPNDLTAFAQLVVDLLDDPGRRHEMGRFGLNRVNKQLAWDYSIPPLLSAYRQIIAAGQAQPLETPSPGADY